MSEELINQEYDKQILKDINNEEDEIIADSPFDTTKLSEDNLKAYIHNLKREISENETKLEFHKKLLVDMDIDRTARLENHDIMINEFVAVNPQWKFEANPKYGANLAIIQGMTKKRDIEQYKMTEEKINQTIKYTEESIKSLKESLEAAESKD